MAENWWRRRTDGELVPPTRSRLKRDLLRNPRNFSVIGALRSNQLEKIQSLRTPDPLRTPTPRSERLSAQSVDKTHLIA